MEKLLQYFMTDTEKKFDSLNAKVDNVFNKIDDLTKFKIEMIASARMTALIVSALCGGITLIGTVVTIIVMVRPHE